MIKRNDKRSGCPISSSLDIWGDKWSLLIVRDMMFFNKHTYGDFLGSPEGIATNILASRLEMLEQAEIISKEEHPDSKAKIFYKLTKKGIDLVPILVEMNLWGNKYFDTSAPAKEITRKAKKDKAKLIRDLTGQLRKV